MVLPHGSHIAHIAQQGAPLFGRSGSLDPFKIRTSFDMTCKLWWVRSLSLLDFKRLRNAATLVQ